MKNEIIKSKENKLYKYLKSLSLKKYRIKNNSYLIEGIKLTEEAIRENLIQKLILSESFVGNFKEFTEGFEDYYIFSDNLFRELTDMINPEGILGLAEIKKTDDQISSSRVLCLDGIKDPGNMGTIIRSAEAFGFKQIILINDCVDIYNPKVIRASMGSLFRTDFIELSSYSELKSIASGDYALIATGLKGIDIKDIDIDSKSILIIGSESHGISKEVLSIADIITSIPMRGDLDSLNAAIAASIYMYELSISL
ncbi:MAG: RNA methyltransferase [Tissierellia bacterium]|nr:RNA methyltransferase [Tissierellia bacterium]